jgi:hypothetical protein
MSSGSCLTSKLYDKILKMPSKSHETIPLNVFSIAGYLQDSAKYLEVQLAQVPLKKKKKHF